MSDRAWIEPIVQRVVGDVLDSHLGQLRTEITRRVMEEVAAAPAGDAASAPAAADLARAVSEIQLGTSQKEILRALLDATSRYAARAALFVVKGSHAAGWQARGFDDDDAVKDFALDSNAPAVVRAVVDRVGASAPLAECDARFLEKFGRPAGDSAQLFPLILKEKVAALVYADGGASGPLDAGSLEVLVLATSSWLEVNALRKLAHKETAAVPQPAGAANSAFNDPFAGHAPAFAMAAAASAAGSSVAAEAETAAEVQSAAAAAAPEPLPVGQVEVADAPDSPAAQMSPEDQGVHQKAQRFARLLVDEIKLYNQAKVSEGRKNKNLYDRLKDTIDKSRSTYQKRYGNTVAASGNYFQHELVRSLAEDDRSLMGPNFHL